MPPRQNTRRPDAHLPWAWVVSVALVVAACGVTDVGNAPTTDPSPTTTRVPPPPIPTTTVPSPSTTAEESHEQQAPLVPDLGPHQTLVALAHGELEVYSAPEGTDVAMTLPATTILGTPTVLGVVEVTNDGWALVRLPVRPNGSTGWIKFESVDFYVVDGRIVVDLSERTLTYYAEGEEILIAEVAIGSTRNPTPTGEFFITDSVELADPNSPWGPHALGLSAYSDTITEYNGGPGIIGIHGTNKPGSIGSAASLGCVRMPNEAITELYALVTLGTPVEIRA
ncbi:MAG: L,D-transpeptidase [Acidimicrobiia bacterium]|nr:L,D-transpeptidase [Acidimicrobiia bacterium]